MRIVKETVGPSFYEFFSDIIFATMAIFVLLMTIFISLINDASPITQAKKQLAELEQQILDKNTDLEELQEENSENRETVAEMSKREVEIAIAVDRTASMEQELYNLKIAILRLAQILPKVTDKVRISVVSYWVDTDTRQDDTRVFPMTDMRRLKDDNGASYNSLLNFMNRQQHAGGTAPALRATEIALMQFSPQQSYKGHQVFMLLGDVGPYEESRDSDVITQAGLARANKLVSSVGNWAKTGKNRNVIVLFSGRDEIDFPQYGPQRRRKHIVSMALFKRIAEAAGQPESYTENQASMLNDFLVAALKRK